MLLTRSALRFPLRRGLPLGRVKSCCSLCSLNFQGDFMWWYPFCVGLSSVPLPGSLIDVFALWVASAFLWCSVSLCFWFFPTVVPFPSSSSSIRPSSGSSLVSFRSYSLRSLLSLALRCFLFALRLIYSVHGSLFLHWPFFVCAITSYVSGCFRVLLLWCGTRSDLRFSLSDEVARWAESLVSLCPFVFYSGRFVRLW